MRNALKAVAQATALMTGHVKDSVNALARSPVKSHVKSHVKSLVTTLALAALTTSAAHAAEAQFNAPPGGNTAPYSESVVAGDLIFLAGQIGIDRSVGELAPGGIGPETTQALENVKTVLERAGASLDDVVKCTVLLADIGDWPAMNTVYARYLPNKPARTAVGGIEVPLNGRLEVECIAYAPQS